MKDEAAFDLATRREQLRLRSAQLRDQIAVRSHIFRPAFSATDRVRGGVRRARRVGDNQALLLLAGAALVGAALVRPRLVLGLGTRALSGWQLYRRVRPIVDGVLRQLG
ncbi:YqjK family protein [Ottowia sp.]|uniref:YqjK family protein n=1 Tax=Ottowia sp. TaxID=1898956 RepID=UPI002B6796E5|nr:YqjK family protein [Ottowia sp.]HOB67821.1 hypothetical protein [Ottowia sp.]HPZ55848.1 hypothetical protein [Ottowia sp.]HQD49409.1 hypothetical protein [Ottowia sp.]